MSIASLGDLAISLRLRKDTAAVKLELANATTELSSGVAINIAEHLRGDFGRLAALENDLERLEGYRTNISEFDLLVAGQQGIIQKLRDLGGISNAFIGSAATINGATIVALGNEAKSVFASSVDALNVQIGGRSIFSGIATDQSALSPAETILAALEVELATAGAVTAVDAGSVLDVWFSPGGGYDTIGYQGSSGSDNSFRVSDSESVTPLETAQATAVRNVLSSLAFGALIERGLFAGDINEQAAVLRLAGEGLLGADEQLIEMQASLGRREGALERARVEVNNHSDALQIARSALIEVDPYEAATRLQQAEVRLQSMYTITGRLSRLSLAEYL
ncbi:MAG: flagellin [Paracoccaceae bacterium]